MKKLFLFIFFSTIVFAQSSDDWKITAGSMIRSELDGRDFNNKTYPLTFTSLRTRVGVQKNFEDKVTLFAQIQDSRIFGQEASTMSDSKNLDLHQGFVQVKNLFDWNLSVKAGRYEVKYGTERFIGAVGWHYIGRSFDGVTFGFNISGFKTDLFALTVYEPNSYIANSTPALYPHHFAPNTSQSLYGFWANRVYSEKHSADLFAYLEVNRKKTNDTDNDLQRWTVGINHIGNYGNLKTTTEAAIQTGKMSSTDIFAYLISISGNYKLNNLTSLGLGLDMLSGTKPGEAKYNTFETNFATNHKFYGYMDYFTNIPLNTEYLGLNDLYLKAKFTPENSKFSFEADVHYFMTNQKSSNDKSSFGQEIDLTVKYSIVQGAALTWGGSIFLPGDLMKDFFNTPQGPREDASFWSYIMMNIEL